MKRPSLQFYPGDWRKDPAVQSLNYFDRGVWIELLCIMHESDERGVLLLNGQPMPVEAIQNLLGLDNQIASKTLATLQARGVIKVREVDGAFFSKRMVEDEALSQIRRNAGSKGGNPALLNQNSSKAQANGNQSAEQNPTPSSSSSSSKQKQEKKKRTPTGVTFGEWIATIPDGANAIPDDHHVYRFAERAGIPEDFVVLAWRQFERDHHDSEKRQSSWPSTFRKYVEKNYLRLWYIREGQYYLTTAGEQLRRAIEAAP